MSRIVLTSLILLSMTACGTKDKHDTKVLPRDVKVIPVEDVTSLTDAGLVYGSASLLKSTPIGDKYLHNIAFTVTNQRNTNRCFLRFYFAVEAEKLRANNLQMEFLEGSVMSLSADATPTNTCLKPQETGFVVAMISNSLTTLEKVSIGRMDESDDSASYQELKQVSIEAVKVENARLEVSLKNLSTDKSLKGYGFTKWISIKDGIIQDWSYFSGSDTARQDGNTIIAPGATIKLTDSHIGLDVQPANVSILLEGFTATAP